MTRILHTSDWHLGATLEGASRDEEHERFLAWLETTLANERVEVLVIAGDVFDQSQPSAEAQRMYYRFLHRVGLGGLVRKVVVVGGNHDSASRLDAPAELLAGLDVHVVGGLQADPSTWDRCLCPLRNQRGEIDAVVAAVPFVHEYRLGVRTVLREPAEVRASFRQEFSKLYRELTDRALTMSNGAPVIATGHLACTAQGASLEKGDTPFEVHMIGLIGALDPSIFDPRIAYVA
ncbi:MAG TPA: exonuclease subunit SbcD, partial [Polyangiaceae bacterium]|nr:exonuclease subunit SbcD [Polyangiaceae bacterium]